MSKSACRAFLLEVKPFIKINTFCKIYGINQSCVSMLMKDNAYIHMVSEDKLNILVNAIIEFCKNFG